MLGGIEQYRAIDGVDNQAEPSPCASFLAVHRPQALTCSGVRKPTWACQGRRVETDFQSQGAPALLGASSSTALSPLHTRIHIYDVRAQARTGVVKPEDLGRSTLLLGTRLTLDLQMTHCSYPLQTRIYTEENGATPVLVRSGVRPRRVTAGRSRRQR
jgi:hypothetical protein